MFRHCVLVSMLSITSQRKIRTSEQKKTNDNLNACERVHAFLDRSCILQINSFHSKTFNVKLEIFETKENNKNE